ncbi:MAG: histidine phosphatase family protein [Solirubrobacteraceae bacterium]
MASSLEGVFLARHGETDDNLEPFRFQGFTDTPLNETGRAQADTLAERVVAQAYLSLWTSDLSRARETAEIIGARLGLTPTLDPRLREGFRGRWEGLYMKDVERAEPELYAAWRRPDPGFRFPDGESLPEQQERVSAALIEIHSSAQLPALVVCHGGSIRVMLCAADPRGLAAFHEFDVPNVAVEAL